MMKESELIDYHQEVKKPIMKKSYKYELGDYVYLKTDCDQLKRMVLSVTFNIGGGIMYNLANGIQESQHYEQEITEEKTFQIN